MAETPIDPPDIAPREAPAEQPVTHEIVLPVPVPARRVAPSRVAWAVYGLAGANVLALWLARDVYVDGWDLFAATYAVLVLHAGSFPQALATIWHAVLNQRQRPVFTGGESFIYGLVPGLLDGVKPWLLWSHLWNLVLFLLLSIWLVRRLRCTPWVYCACVLASPALVSLSITGLPDLPSTAIPYGLTIGYLLADAGRDRRVVWNIVRDVAVFAAVTAVAFNGYESGKTFFIVPVIAALTLADVPLARRIAWIACAGAIAALVHDNQAMTTQTALAAVPHDVEGFLRGLRAFAHEYVVTWYIDFPALALTAFASLLVLRERRLFWTALLFAALGLVSLNAFQFDGAFLVPHRYLLLGFVSALVVSRTLSQMPRPRAAALLWIPIVLGIGYTSFTTGRFVLEKPPATVRDWNGTRVYPLPYNRARLDAHVWRDRVADAKTLVARVQQGTEPHVLFYGFTAAGEDSVNPQLIVSRLLLPLGYDVFTRRVAFFDDAFHMYFPFPVKPLADVRPTLAGLPTPFFVHVREPEHAAADVIARFLNHSVVTPVDLGLKTFVSVRVDAYAPPGSIPVRPLAAGAAPEPAARAGYAAGFCEETWKQDAGEHSPLLHQDDTLAGHFDRVLLGARDSGPPQYLDVTRTFATTGAARFDRAAVAYFFGWVDNPTDQPVPVKLSVLADDEVAVAINDQSIVESVGWKGDTRYGEHVLLPPGTSQVKIIYHKFWHAGGVVFAAQYEDGRPVVWQCDPAFH